MDALRTTTVQTSRLARACQFRVNAALTTVQSAQATYNADKSDANRAALTTALINLASARSDHANAQAQAKTAERDLNATVATRSHRPHKTVLDKVDHSTATPTGIDLSTSYATTLKSFFDSNSTLPFPSPPAIPCGKPSCLRTAPTRALPACPCAIRAAFEGYSAKELKGMKTAFAGENFSEADDKAKAGEVSEVLNAMLKHSAAEAKIGSAADKGMGKSGKRSAGRNPRKNDAR